MFHLDLAACLMPLIDGQRRKVGGGATRSALSGKQKKEVKRSQERANPGATGLPEPPTCCRRGQGDTGGAGGPDAGSNGTNGTNGKSVVLVNRKSWTV